MTTPEAIAVIGIQSYVRHPLNYHEEHEDWENCPQATVVSATAIKESIIVDAKLLEFWFPSIVIY